MVKVTDFGVWVTFIRTSTASIATNVVAVVSFVAIIFSSTKEITNKFIVIIVDIFDLMVVMVMMVIVRFMAIIIVVRRFCIHS